MRGHDPHRLREPQAPSGEDAGLPQRRSQQPAVSDVDPDRGERVLPVATADLEHHLLGAEQE